MKQISERLTSTICVVSLIALTLFFFGFTRSFVAGWLIGWVGMELLNWLWKMSKYNSISLQLEK
jgi:hypothetical protein